MFREDHISCHNPFRNWLESLTFNKVVSENTFITILNFPSQHHSSERSTEMKTRNEDCMICIQPISLLIWHLAAVFKTFFLRLRTSQGRITIKNQMFSNFFSHRALLKLEIKHGALNFTSQLCTVFMKYNDKIALTLQRSFIL